ncbi:hypothetical protein HOP50_09g55680 [Chloropicon primus]|nr:hypothetical protein A3770_09p55420 [Chloropicon primus]UPR02242.1 hypothetical protein HOP50_09g55680 [Chloropicon primus]|eukprot:QDZ23024.1 hypothetical protein A3770_09p55420 [Chloropicon primus]
MKTTRFRPIAPRPQEGVPTTTATTAATMKAIATAKAAPTPNTPHTRAAPSSTPVDPKCPGIQQEKVGQCCSVSTSKQQPTTTTTATTPNANITNITNITTPAANATTNDISLDPKNFCYADLKSLSDFETTTSSVSTGFYGGYSTGYYGGFNHIQYAPGSNMSDHPFQPPASMGFGGPSMYYNSSNDGNSGNPKKEQQQQQAAADGVKLDLDEDSVAKAFGDDGDASKKRKSSSESDGSVDTTSNQGKKQADGGSGSDNETNAPGPRMMVASGSIVKNLSGKGSNSFLNCIEKGSTNPLFHIDKRLACSFISEYLDKDEEAIDLVKGFEVRRVQKKQKV